MSSSDVAQTARVHAALVVAQLCFAGFDILSKLALSDGVTPVIFLIYRNGIAFLLLTSLALLLERNNRPPLSASLLCQLFLLGTTGVFLNQVLYLVGMKNTSAPFASASQNIFPALTFILAIIFRLEKLFLDRRDGVAKVTGTILSVGGSMIMTFYKGPAVRKLGFSGRSTNPHVNFLDLENTFIGYPLSTIQNWQIGALCLFGATLSVSCSLIIQVPVLARYPAPLKCAAFTSFFGTIQLFIYAFFETSHKNWVPITPTDILGVIYAGIFASGIYSFILTWCNYKGGPVLVAAYQPLETLFVLILGLYFCMDTLYLGSILGALLVIAGLFLLTWGLGEAARICSLEKKNLFSSSNLEDPLLVPSYVA